MLVSVVAEPDGGGVAVRWLGVDGAIDVGSVIGGGDGDSCPPPLGADVAGSGERYWGGAGAFENLPRDRERDLARAGHGDGDARLHRKRP